MKVEITANDLYQHKGVRDFHMRSQSEQQFMEMADKYDMDELFSAIDVHFEDLDDMEECFYDMTEEEMCKILDIEYVEDEEDKE